ncbi:DUF3237 family protein [Draconibacterium orientale]|uniref:DUF3237 family protein n=1 Tax=Draconibacterium orientale TaxID=1168034 RepID=UPI0029C03E0D|nr:DUF3237 family protein [Draconibacterium orientale]
MNFSFHKNRVGTVAFVLLLIISIHGFAQNSNSENSESIFRDFKTELMWKANVKIGTMINVGESKRGTRRVIPITGGTFSGPKINGEVLPGGEDWQLVRPDGDTELYARYLMKTDDGIVLQILNKALMHAPAPGEEGGFYVKSVIDIEAPIESSYDYLNHAIFLGTLEMPQLKPNEEPYVIIGVYKVL